MSHSTGKPPSIKYNFELYPGNKLTAMKSSLLMSKSWSSSTPRYWYFLNDLDAFLAAASSPVVKSSAYIKVSSHPFRHYQTASPSHSGERRPWLRPALLGNAWNSHRPSLPLRDSNIDQKLTILTIDFECDCDADGS